MRRLLLLIGVSAVLSACGDDSESGGSAGGAGGLEAGVGGTGGSGAETAGGQGGSETGGRTGTGGSNGGGAGGGGTGGTGEPDASASACPPPTGPNETAICLTLDPEDMTFETDPKFDGSGVLAIEMFDINNPPSDGAGVALYSAVLPPNAATGGEISLDSLPSPRIVLPNMSSTADAGDAMVYFRVIFLDNPDALTGGDNLVPGAWIGGLDLSGGLTEGLTLTPVSITPGTGNAVSVGLAAVRALSVTVDASATPIGDGEGPLVMTVTNQANPASQPPSFGFGSVPCADVSSMPFTHVMPMIGSGGTYYVTGFLNDLGLPGEFPPGVLAALDADLQAGTATIPAVLNLAQTDYTPTVSIDLSFLLPLPADAGAVPPNSCADIAAAANDGGVGDSGAP